MPLYQNTWIWLGKHREWYFKYPFPESPISFAVLQGNLLIPCLKNLDLLIFLRYIARNKYLTVLRVCRPLHNLNMCIFQWLLCGLRTAGGIIDVLEGPIHNSHSILWGSEDVLIQNFEIKGVPKFHRKKQLKNSWQYVDVLLSPPISHDSQKEVFHVSWVSLSFIKIDQQLWYMIISNEPFHLTDSLLHL